MKKLGTLTALFLITLLANGCTTKGDPGPAGPIGPAGGRVVRSIYCQGDVVSPYVEIDGLGIEYNAVVTSAGDVYATANIIDSEGQTSGTSFYASAEAQVNQAAVNITADYIGSANEGYWTISLDRNTLITSIVYDDQSLAGPLNMHFTAASCTVHAF